MSFDYGHWPHLPSKAPPPTFPFLPSNHIHHSSYTCILVSLTFYRVNTLMYLGMKNADISSTRGQKKALNG